MVFLAETTHAVVGIDECELDRQGVENSGDEAPVQSCRQIIEGTSRDFISQLLVLLSRIRAEAGFDGDPLWLAGLALSLWALLVVMRLGWVWASAHTVSAALGLGGRQIRPRQAPHVPGWPGGGARLVDAGDRADGPADDR